MKLAIIADIHGNIPALEAVLRDIKKEKPDQVVVNGDLVNRGPSNVAVMERIFAEDFVLTLGNHDAFVTMWVDRDKKIPKEWFRDPFWHSIDIVARQLSDAGWLEVLRDLPMTHEISIPGSPKLLISHGSPRHYREGYGSYISDENLREITRAFPADIYIGSHIHRPVDRMLDRFRFLNTSAVGVPFNGDPRAQYLMMTLKGKAWEAEFRIVDYDHHAALRDFETSGYVSEGGLSAFIFQEELRYARALFNPFWFWTEENDHKADWETWKIYWEMKKEKLNVMI